jgi:hypothetical protein
MNLEDQRDEAASGWRNTLAYMRWQALSDNERDRSLRAWERSRRIEHEMGHRAPEGRART